MKTIITGASGLLGTYLRYAQMYSDTEEIGITHSSQRSGLLKLDLTREMNIHRLFSDHKPDVIIHCAAMGNVDYAELNPQIAYEVNVGMTEKLARISSIYNPKFVYISSNAVYKGDNPPYKENSPQQPANIYGRTKRQAEDVIRSTCNDYLIIRPFLLFGKKFNIGGRPNWYSILYDHFTQRRPISLIDDIGWQPTSVVWAANVIWKLIDTQLTEVNLSQGQSMSLYKFGMIMQNVYNQHHGTNLDLINPVHATDFKTVAPRPGDTSYDIEILEAALGGEKPPSIVQSLTDIMVVNNE